MRWFLYRSTLVRGAPALLGVRASDEGSGCIDGQLFDVVSYHIAEELVVWVDPHLDCITFLHHSAGSETEVALEHATVTFDGNHFDVLHRVGVLDGGDPGHRPLDDKRVVWETVGAEKPYGTNYENHENNTAKVLLQLHEVLRSIVGGLYYYSTTCCNMQ